MQNQPVLPSEPRSPFSSIEKAALLLLVVAGLGGMFLGGRYLVRNLTLPFQLTLMEDVSLATQQEELEIQAMKERDTDSDGLNDYDEQEIYGTSPYLADSDSDGYDDKVELESDNDPNCPTGSTCDRSEEASVDLGEQILTNLDVPEGDLEQYEALLKMAQQDPQSVIEQFTPSQLRELLAQNGIDEATLAQVSDEELLYEYEAALELYKQTQTANP